MLKSAENRLAMDSVLHRAKLLRLMIPSGATASFILSEASQRRRPITESQGVFCMNLFATRNRLGPETVAFLGAVLLSCPALGHPGHDLTGFSSGFSHPLTGLDHILCALAVGILAVSKKNQIHLSIPLSFIAAMACGIWMGRGVLYLPFYEQGITLSLVLLGLCLVVGSHLKSWGGFALVAVFGVLHGNAHGIEVDQGALGFPAAFGLVLATGLLLGMGVGLSLMVRRFLAEKTAGWALRIFGAGVLGAAALMVN